MLLRDYLAAQARTWPERTAYVAGGSRRTWGETVDRVGRLSAALAALWVRKGDVVATLGKDGFTTVEVWFSAAATGAIRTGINWRYSAREVEHILRDARVSALLVEGGGPEELLSKVDLTTLPDLRRIIGYGEHAQELDYETLLAEHAPLVPEDWPDIAEEDAIAIHYTTGSTGLPKGVVWSQRSVVAAQLNTWLQSGARHDDVFLHCLPAAGVPILLATWNVFVGGTIVLMPQFSAGEALRLIEAERVTATLLVPTMMLDVLDHPDRPGTDLSSLRMVMYGSAPASPALVRRAIDGFGCALQQWYGSTEGVGGWFALLHDADHRWALEHDPGLLQSCGRPTLHTELRIVDEQGSALPPGEIGEIVVRSEAVMTEYLGMPAETAESLPGGGWLKTGDVGRLDERGYLYLVDRKKFLIITGAYNVYPVVVENVLAEHPAVREVLVVGAPDERWGEVVVAVVVPHGEVAEEELKSFCRGRLATFEVPKRIVFVDQLPRGATGKLLKREVRDWFREPAGAPVPAS
jgi:acyl-CoA synthetase (AMP-forming)/AMP-acid ligase II